MTTTETPVEALIRLNRNSTHTLTWDNIRAIAEHEIKHQDFLSAGLDLVDDAEIAEWNEWTESNRAWFERHL